jgi:hypothetical protein
MPLSNKNKKGASLNGNALHLITLAGGSTAFATASGSVPIKGMYCCVIYLFLGVKVI